MGKPHNFSSFSSIFQTFENTRECLSAFSAMLCCVLEQDTSGALSGQACGAIMMLDQQIEDLENISDALKCEVASLQRSKLQISDTGEIARMLGVPKSTVDYVVSKVFEVAAPSADADDEAEIDAGMMKALRENSSADETSQMHDAEQIAKTLNLKASTVQRVIDVLTAGDKPYREGLALNTRRTDSKAVNE